MYSVLELAQAKSRDADAARGDLDCHVVTVVNQQSGCLQLCPLIKAAQPQMLYTRMLLPSRYPN